MAFEKLKNLGQDRLAEIDRMLISGETAAAVARTVCRKWNEYPTEEKSLTRMVRRYKTQELAPNLKALADCADPQRAAMAKEALDCLERGRFIFDAQKQRVEKWLGREKMSPFPLKGTTADIGVLNRVNDSLSKLEFETGVVRRAPKSASTPTRFIGDPYFELERDQWEADIREHAEMRKALVDCVKILRTPDDQLPAMEEEPLHLLDKL